ncbi:hypothetical protein C7999DRAFT_32536 [Corynascus novoguineensis]|uniref:Uncharacterized protein n=1 Tax=Corynascus novoguineensis TaxID=1126955 RepID=A0AAN7CRN9_9PEZI|nr:hypothetical protein C7999DRAFT_32536 [Corynascus novoguineensis]
MAKYITSHLDLLAEPRLGLTRIQLLLSQTYPRVILDRTDSTDIDLARYAPILAHGRSDRWVLDPVGESLMNPVRAHPCGVPRIHVPNHIRLVWEELEKLKDAGQKKLKGPGYPNQGVKLGTQLAYFMVVEGVEAGNCQKLVLRATAEQFAVQAYFEALSGFSVVFSGLMLKRQLALLGRHDVRLSFVRVANVEDLLQEADSGSGSHVDDAASTWHQVTNEKVAATVFVCF